MIQGGDPNSRNARPGQQLGTGGPGYTIPAEFDTENIHLKGALSAARTGGPSNPQKRSSGSQFYIVQGNPLSDYTVFGMVTEGLDIIDKIAAVQTQPGDRPVEDVKMKIVVKEVNVQ